VIRPHQVSSYLPCVSERTSHSDPSGSYEIRIQGHLQPRWNAWFDELTLSIENDGTTLIRGDLVDQAALHGLLSKLADLGLPLLSVTHIGPDRAETTTTTTDR
jgi:hypothetical protein